MDITPQIDAVLRCLSGSGLPDVVRFTAAATALDQAGVQAMPRAHELSVPARRKLHSALGQLGAKLAALEQRLQERIRRHPADDSVAMYPMLACACLYTTGRIAIATGCRGRDAEQLLPSAALLLGTGRANLRRLAAIDNAAEAGLHLMAVYMLLNVAIEDDGAWARAGALFAPHAATEWLAAVTQALLADAWQDGVGDLKFVGAYAAVCYHLLPPRHDSHFRALRAAVAADAALQQRIADLLLGPCLRSAVAVLVPAAAAVAAPRWQVPNDAAELMGNHWRQLQHTMMALQVPFLEPHVAQQLRPRQQQAELQRMAVQLFWALLLELPPATQQVSEVTLNNFQISALHLLCISTGVQRYWLEREPAGGQAATAGMLREAAWDVLALMPRIAVAVAGVVRGNVMDLTGKLMTAGAVPLLCLQLAHVGCARSAAEAAQLLTAADAAVSRLLPLAHGLWQQRRAAGQQQLPPEDVSLALACLRLLTNTCSVLKHGAYDGSDAAPPGSPAEHAAAAIAARRLQVTMLRLVHWAAGTASVPAFLADVGALYGSLLELHEACHVAQEAADAVASVSGPLASGAGDAQAQSRLQGAGVAAARFEEAHRVLLSLGPGLTEGRSKRDLQRTMLQLLSLVSDAPPALLSDATLGLLGRVTAAALRGEHGLEACERMISALCVLQEPHLWAAALASGAVAAMLEVPAWAPVAQQEKTSEVLIHFMVALERMQKQALTLADELDAAGTGASDCGGGSGSSGDTSVQQQLREAAEQLGRGIAAFNQVIVGTTALPRVAAVLGEQALPAAEAAARLWRTHWQQPAQAVTLRLEAAHAAATRCCAYLQCSNVGQAGGPFAGQGEGSKRCSQCRAVWYCSTACSHADWRHGGHKLVCKALAAERAERKAQAAAGGRRWQRRLMYT
ncbi:hypothetical protein COHA_003369 [Chlorella ohadii]|uniref:MYND-type domain-containing protein n=1 Tax=Chlorella ohadii TaxID=2649997 RepID=A0AAD5H814_9CHLO|nr:hypothetical protein COHA_003369 [Chlorella ohadii]